MPDWKKIKAEYIRGGTSFRKLATKHGVSFSSVKRRASVEKWTDLRTQSYEKSTTKIVESVADKEAKRVDFFEDISNSLLDYIKNGIADGTIELDKRTLRDITGALKDLRDIKGLKSEADLREQMARIKKLEKEASADEQTKEISVVISNDLADFGN